MRKISVAECVRRYRKNNPLANKARIKVFVAKRNGSLKQEPCKKCNNPISEAHHEDYRKPLEVIWLCKRHHAEADIKRRERLEKEKELKRIRGRINKLSTV